jgi:ABC-2 type transport system permease protein
MIRLTLAAAPTRRRILAAKTVVFGGVARAVGEGTAFVAFVVGTVSLPSRIEGPAPGDPGVLRAVILAGLGFSLIGLIGLALGLVIRHTAAAFEVLVGGVYVVAQMIGAPLLSAAGYAPVSIVANSLSTVQPMGGCRRH